MKGDCNVLGISILYTGNTEVLSVLFPCFILEHYAVLHARIIAKMDCSFLLLPNFGRITRPHTPISLPSTPKTPPLNPCSDARNPVSSYPKTPFGMSHFTIWDTPFRHLGYIFGTFAHNVQPRFSVCLLRFSLQKFVCFFPFGSSCFFGIRLAG